MGLGEAVRDLPCSALENTKLYREDCHRDFPKINLRDLLITGTGGTGTHTMTMMLRYSGVSVQHEDVGVEAAVAWPYAVDAEVQCRDMFCPGYPWGPEYMPQRFRHVFHQTRCPLKNIGALLTHSHKSFHFISRLADQPLNRLSRLERAVRAYIAWNEHIETYAEYRYQVENVNLTEICALAGLADRYDCSRQAAFPRLKRNIRRHDTVTLEQIYDLNYNLGKKVRQIGLRYGYESCQTDCAC